MKKIIFVLIGLISALLLLTGCGHYYYDYDELTDSVQQIYIVDVQRSEYYGDITVEYLEEVEGEDFNSLLEQLSNLRYEWSVLLEPQNNTGRSIMLIYNREDYDYAIVGLTGIEKFKNDEEVYFKNAVCDEDAFSQLLSNYYTD